MSGAGRRRSGPRPTTAPPRRRRLSPADQRRQQRGSPPPVWGWHRLRSDWAQTIVEQSGVAPGDLVLDLGAGDGALTRPLAKAGARVIAIELHPGRAQRLRERFGDLDAVQVVEHDLRELRLPGRPFRVVANPPWSMAKPLIAALTGPRARLVQADLVLQRGLVGDLDKRGTAGTGPRRRFRTGYARSIPGTAFRPPPPGPAALLRITR